MAVLQTTAYYSVSQKLPNAAHGGAPSQVLGSCFGKKVVKKVSRWPVLGVG